MSNSKSAPKSPLRRSPVAVGAGRRHWEKPEITSGKAFATTPSTVEETPSQPPSSVVSPVTEPPIVRRESGLDVQEPPPATPTDERSVARLRQPRIVLFRQTRIHQLSGFPQCQNQAAELRAAFERRRTERRRALRAIIDALGRQILVVSSFNTGYVPMFRNWAASCDRHGIPSRQFTVLFPTDAEADGVAREHGFTTYFDGESMGAVPAHANKTYGDLDFALAMFPKVAALQDLLDLGVDVLRQDIDLVWFEDPRPRLDALAHERDLDLLFMRDVNVRFQPLYYNSGFVFIRNNDLTRFTWKRVFDAMPQILFLCSEQEVVTQIVACYRERGLRTARLPDEYIDGELMVRASKGNHPLPAHPIVAHASWTENLAQKIERFKGLGMWYLE